MTAELSYRDYIADGDLSYTELPFWKKPFSQLLGLSDD